MRKKAQDYQNERKKRLDEITSKRANARTEILKTLQSILAKYADQNQISLILDKKEIVIGKKNLEATDEIIIELDKKLSNFLSTQLNTQSSMLQLTNQLNENGLIDKKTKKIFENLDKGIKQLISKNKK